MQSTRSILVGLTAVVLLGLPTAALATAPVGPATGATGVAKHTAGASITTKRHVTTIWWLDFSHMRPAGRMVDVKGQVASHRKGQRGALAGARVKLYRRLDGSSRWVYLGSQRTSTSSAPEFSFTTQARQRAHYKVTFAGDSSFGPSSAVTWVNVYRLFVGVMTDGGRFATLHGHVTPFYTHKAISLQKRSCPSCSYTTVQTKTTGTGGTYSFSLPAPAARPVVVEGDDRGHRRVHRVVRRDLHDPAHLIAPGSAGRGYADTVHGSEPASSAARSPSP